MDIQTARTFLEIVKTGSFVRASENLNLTQTAVSARIRVLETELNRPLFVRNKAGARMTAAGEQFFRHASTLVQVWDRARQQVAVPEGRQRLATVGGEHSLWNPLLLDWLVRMRNECADVAIRVHIDDSDRLIERVQDGVLDLAVVYAPPQRPGIIAELLLEEQLVAVTSHPDHGSIEDEDYVYVDWGPEFAISHHTAFPEAPGPNLSVNHGPLALEYILAVGGTGYFRLGAARPYIAAGQLNLVEDMPSFSYSVHAVYSAKADEELMELMRHGLKTVAIAGAHH